MISVSHATLVVKLIFSARHTILGNLRLPTSPKQVDDGAVPLRYSVHHWLVLRFAAHFDITRVSDQA